MKKNSFIQGAFIATFAIVISKVIGILYVIPFYPLIGEKGGALYAYAYTIYTLFLNLSTAGIPFAISKITSEYNALGYLFTKEKAYKMGRLVICSFGMVSFVLLFIFAKEIAYLFIGNIKGGNTIEDVAFVVRVVSLALLVVPIQSVTRGYLQGHKYIAPSAMSQVYEQIIRVLFLLLGTFLALRVFYLSLTISVGIAVFAATVGAFFSYIYIHKKIKKNKEVFFRDTPITDEERKITSKMILKKILAYSIPFIMIDFMRSCYNFVNLITINKTMAALGYTMAESESVVSIFSTWGMKLESIIFAVSTGIVVSLIPNISSSHVLNDKEDIKRKINMAFQALTVIILPLTVLLSVLATPVWTMFFGSSNELGPIIFRVAIYEALVIAVFNTTVSILHSISYSKTVVYTLILGLAIKVMLNVPLMHAFNALGMQPSYGVVVATIMAFGIPLIINLIFIKKKLNIDYRGTFDRILKMVFAILIAVIAMMTLQLFIPINTTSRLMAILLFTVYTIVGGGIYIFILTKNNTIYEIFGRNIYKRIFSKFKRKKD
jgi:O-antigen/teichoic acid export membrane protein